jgi:hypothetical protein
VRGWSKTAHKIGWRPVDFWPSTMREFFDAIDAQNEMNGEEDEASAPSDNEMQKLIAKYG